MVDEWDAYKKWDFDYLKEKLKGLEVTVSQTPNGRADSPFFLLPSHLSSFPSLSPSSLPSPIDFFEIKTGVEGEKEGEEEKGRYYFITPYEEKIPFSSFVSLLQNAANNSTAYYIQVLLFDQLHQMIISL